MKIFDPWSYFTVQHSVMKKILFVFAITVSANLCSEISQAAGIQNTPCVGLGSHKTVASTPYVCIRKNSKLIWATVSSNLNNISKSSSSNQQNISQAQGIADQVSYNLQLFSSAYQQSQVNVESASNACETIQSYEENFNFSSELLQNKLASAQSTLNYQINFANSHPPGFSNFTLAGNIQNAQRNLNSVQQAVQKFDADLGQFQNAKASCLDFSQQIQDSESNIATAQQRINALNNLAIGDAPYGRVANEQSYLSEVQQIVSQAQELEGQQTNLSVSAKNSSDSAHSLFEDAQMIASLA